MKNVLFVSYFYPPLGGVAARRAAGLARHLPDEGWRPLVVTPRDGQYFRDGGADRDPEGPEVHRTRAPDLTRPFRSLGRRMPGVGASPDEAQPLRTTGWASGLRAALRRLLYVPDARVAWLPFAFRAGVRAARDRKVEVVYSSAFPVTAHLAGALLARWLGVPWVAEFRDPWTWYPLEPREEGFRLTLDRRIETGLVRRASAVVTVSRGWAEEYRRRFPGEPERKFRVVTNGFEPEELGRVAEEPGAGREPDRPLTLAYTGTLYPRVQDPGEMLEGIGTAARSWDGGLGGIRLVVAGPREPALEAAVARAGLADVTTFRGFVPHEEALRIQMEADVLLLPISGTAPELRGWLPGKVFEYLGSGTPILAAVPPGFEVGEVIRRGGDHQVVPPRRDAVARALDRLRGRRSAGNQGREGRARTEAPRDALSPFTYGSLARDLAHILEDVLP